MHSDHYKIIYKNLHHNTKKTFTVKILSKNLTLQSHIVSSSSFLTVSVKDKVTGEVSVRAVCHRSMKKSEKPHDLRVGLLLGQWLGKLINCLSA